MTASNGKTNGKAPAVVGARDGSNAPKDILALLNHPTTQKRMKGIAAQHLSAERLMRVVALAIHNTPNLVKCKPMSLLGATFECAQLGMEPNTPLQHCHLVPYKKKKKTPDNQWVEEYDVEVIIGYRGYIDLARRSGLTPTIHADVVYAADVFDHEHGSNQFLKHKPRLMELDAEGRQRLVEDRGAAIGYYAYCKLDGGEAFKVMSVADVRKIRDEAQSYQTALYLKDDAERKGWKVPPGWLKCPWVKHFDAMGRKSPIRRLSSELPLSIEHSRALQLDGASIDYAQVAEASDSEIVDLDPSHWQYDDEDEDETGPEVNGQPAGDDAPARIEQSAEQPIKTVEQREPEKEPVKAAAARRSGQGSGQTAGLFQD